MPNKRQRWFILGGTVLLFVLILIINSIVLPNTRNFNGKVISLGENVWGLENNWEWYRPLAQQRYRVVDLPTAYQQQGAQIKGKFRVVENMGLGSYDAIIQPVTIK